MGLVIQSVLDVRSRGGVKDRGLTTGQGWGFFHSYLEIELKIVVVSKTDKILIFTLVGS